MVDYEYIFAMNLHEKLKQLVIGWIFCEIDRNDRLHVVIKTKRGDFEFETYVNDISDKIVNGYTTDYATYEIMQKYKRFITNRFIINN